MDWRSRLDSEEHRNWVSVGHALSLLCDGVRPYIERKMKAFHGQLQLAVGPGTKCLCVHTPRRRPNPWHDMIHCRWAAAIQNYYAGNPRKIAWHQSNSNVWDDPGAGPWEIAKLFMSDLGPNDHLVVDAQSTDPTGLINLMLWCGYLGVQQYLADDVREIRNSKWAHAPRQRLTNADKEDAFRCMKELLEDPILAADRDATNCLNEIQSLEEADLVTLQQAEVNALQELKAIIKLERVDATRIQSIDENVTELLNIHDKNKGSYGTELLLYVCFTLKVVSIIRKALWRTSNVLLFLSCLTLCAQELGNGTLSDGKLNRGFTFRCFVVSHDFLCCDIIEEESLIYCGNLLLIFRKTFQFFKLVFILSKDMVYIATSHKPLDAHSFCRLS